MNNPLITETSAATTPDTLSSHPRRNALLWVVTLGVSTLTGGAGWWSGRLLSPEQADTSPPDSSAEQTSAPAASAASSAAPSPAASATGGKTPALVGKGLAELDALVPAGQKLEMRIIAVKGGAAARVVSQDPPAGRPMTGTITVVVRGKAELVRLDEVATGVPAATAMGLQGRQVRGHLVSAQALREGVRVRLPRGSVRLVWLAWLPNNAEGRATLEVVDKAGRQRLRASVGGRSMHRAAVPTTDAQELVIRARGDLPGPVAFGDAGIEVVR